MEVKDIIDDTVAKFAESGYQVEVTYCLNQKGELLEVKIRIVGRLA